MAFDPIEEQRGVAHVPLVQIGQSANLALCVCAINTAELPERIDTINPFAEIGNWHAGQCTIPEPGMPVSVAFLQPTSIAETIDSLRAYRGEARLVAGGTALSIMLREGLIHPSALISLHGVPGL